MRFWTLKQNGWCRVSIARSVETLRAFFRYAQHRGGGAAGIAVGVERPRLYRDEGLPVGPWHFFIRFEVARIVTMLLAPLPDLLQATL